MFNLNFTICLVELLPHAANDKDIIIAAPIVIALFIMNLPIHRIQLFTSSVFGQYFYNFLRHQFSWTKIS